MITTDRKDKIKVMDWIGANTIYEAPSQYNKRCLKSLNIPIYSKACGLDPVIVYFMPPPKLPA